MTELLAALETSAVSTWIRESPSIWAYPTILTLHTVGLGLLVGPSWALDLRLLGAVPAIPLRALEKAFPVMWAGFWINGLTGVALFVTEATTKGATPLFATKLGLIAVAVATLVVTRRVVFQRAAEPVIGPAARGLAILSIVLWIAAIGTGRWMAYV